MALANRWKYLPLLIFGACIMTGASGERNPQEAVSRPTSTPASSPTSSLKSSITSSLSQTVSLLSAPTSTVKSSLTSSATQSAVVSGPSGSVKSAASGSIPGSSITLSPYAEEVARIIKFDRQILLIVKEETQEHIQRLIGYDENNYQIIVPGFAVAVPEERTDRILALLRQKLIPLKYLPFICEINSGMRIDKIGIIKSSDQYDILRVMHTDGNNYDISNQDVIDRLKEWEWTSAFDVIGADSDWVELEFKTLPLDLKAFAADVYEFSPDTIDQGAGSIEEFIKEIKKTNRVFLLWE